MSNPHCLFVGGVEERADERVDSELVFVGVVLEVFDVFGGLEANPFHNVPCNTRPFLPANTKDYLFVSTWPSRP